MALITCKECGKEKVSDQADACPSCGFSFRYERHLEERKEDREDRQAEAARKGGCTLLGAILGAAWATISHWMEWPFIPWL